jgi:adenylate cyclase
MRLATHRIEAVTQKSFTDGPWVERRLAAIMSGDVVGYSRLMAEDESATVWRLRACRDHVGQLVERHRGRVVDFTGDNFLAEFCSVVDAVTCALAIQKGLRSSNEKHPRGRWMELRIGLHLGEVRIEEGRLYGNGVNIAARLESLADPGGVCVSQAVVGEITSRVPVVCDDLGKKSVKNIPEPIRVFRLHALGSAAPTAPQTHCRQRARGAALAALVAVLATLGTAAFSAIATDTDGPGVQPASMSSIAVLPFADMSAAQDERYFAEGLVEQLTHALANVRALRVAARTSAFAVTREGRDMRTIGHLLHADTVIEGSVRKTSKRLRVTVQAIRVADGYHLWSRIYDYEDVDALTIQDDIARSVADTLTPQLAREAAGPELCEPGEGQRPPRVRTHLQVETRAAIPNADAG